MRARLLAVLAALAACSAPPLERYLRLEAMPVPLPAAGRAALAGDLQMQPFDARGLLSGRHVVYLDTATGETSPAATLIWEDQPAVAVNQVITRVLQAAQIAPAVLPAGTQGLANFWIDASVDRFELVVRPGQPDRVTVRLAFTLTAGHDRRPALIARYCQSAPGAADPAHGFSLAVSRIGARLAGDIAAHARQLNGTVAAPVLIGQGMDSNGGGCDGDA